MPQPRKTPEPWNSFLVELDRAAAEETRLECMGGFVVTLLYGLSRETADLDVLLIAPGERRIPLLELGGRGGELHRKYKVYLDYVDVAKVPEDYEERLTEMLPGAYNIFGYLRSIPMTSRFPSWNETSSAIATT